MSYKTVLVHVDKDKHAVERIKLAAQIAMNDEAHLIGAAPSGVSRFIYQSRFIYEGGGMASHLDSHLEELRKAAKDSLTQFEGTVKGLGVQSYEARQVDDE